MGRVSADRAAQHDRRRAASACRRDQFGDRALGDDASGPVLSGSGRVPPVSITSRSVSTAGWGRRWFSRFSRKPSKSIGSSGTPRAMHGRHAGLVSPGGRDHQSCVPPSRSSRDSSACMARPRIIDDVLADLSFAGADQGAHQVAVGQPGSARAGPNRARSSAGRSFGLCIKLVIGVPAVGSTARAQNVPGGEVGPRHLQQPKAGVSKHKHAGAPIPRRKRHAIQRPSDMPRPPPVRRRRPKAVAVGAGFPMTGCWPLPRQRGSRCRRRWSAFLTSYA